MRIIIKSDEGCRKGCHPVHLLHDAGKKTYEFQIFSIDEPGAWFDDKWNCHVDGTDYPFDTKEQAVFHGLLVRGYIHLDNKAN
jgi:hypothetical protein